MPGERREREKQELRQHILDAAYAIAEQEGWQAVTIRKVAERVEYSPPIIYEHFASKEELLLELRREGYRYVQAALEQASASTNDPELRLVLMGDIYWDFAWKKLAYFQLMQGLGVSICDPTKIGQDAVPLRAIFHKLIQSLVEARGAQLVDVDDAVDTIWGMQEGLIHITMQGRIAGGRERARKLARKAIYDLLTAWSVQRPPGTVLLAAVNLRL